MRRGSEKTGLRSPGRLLRPKAHPGLQAWLREFLLAQWPLVWGERGWGSVVLAASAGALVPVEKLELFQTMSVSGLKLALPASPRRLSSRLQGELAFTLARQMQLVSGKICRRYRQPPHGLDPDCYTMCRLHMALLVLSVAEHKRRLLPLAGAILEKLATPEDGCSWCLRRRDGGRLSSEPPCPACESHRCPLHCHCAQRREIRKK